jgi:hypothetical protein
MFVAWVNMGISKYVLLRGYNMINQILSRQVIGQPNPKIGMGATILMYSDRHAGTIIDIYCGKEITIQVDKATVISGSTYDGSAQYSYTKDSNGELFKFKKDKKGIWRELYVNDKGNVCMTKQGEGHGLKIGVRMEYYDPTF